MKWQLTICSLRKYLVFRIAFISEFFFVFYVYNSMKMYLLQLCNWIRKLPNELKRSQDLSQRKEAHVHYDLSLQVGWQWRHHTAVGGRRACVRAWPAGLSFGSVRRPAKSHAGVCSCRIRSRPKQIRRLVEPDLTATLAPASGVC